MSNTTPRGYFENVLAFDSETSGLAYGGIDPVHSPDGYFQMVSAGMIVTDAATFSKTIDELYVEIQWNGTSLWNAEAERVHGLSKSYLQVNGKSEEEAVVEIANFLVKHFGTQCIRLLGHNVATFDRCFLYDLMIRHGLDMKFGNRHIDTFALSMGTIGAFNSDDLFDSMGLPIRDASKHNALDDARYAMASAQRIQKLWTGLIGVGAYD